MKALSIRQPWAWLIVEGIKDVENRTWNTNHRGRFWIHASSFNDKTEYIIYARHILTEYGVKVPAREEVLRGGIIGSANLMGVLYPSWKSSYKWHEHNCYGFQMIGATHVPFMKCRGRRGQLSFFEIKGM